MKLFTFGESLKEYPVPVLNEREVRAAAGILFVFAFISFMNASLLGNYLYIKLFVTSFLIDFTIRLFINPKYSPTMIFGRLVTSNQKVEYVGAPQKKFAWTIGIIMAITMFWLVVLNNTVGLVNLIICLTCLTFLLCESAFGICLGCYVYDLFHKDKAQLCPGGACEIKIKEPIQTVNMAHLLILGLFVLLIYGIYQILQSMN